MDNTPIHFKNEFDQPVSDDTIENFNTLQAFSGQSTGLLETTLADTLGLSMHNAVVHQQQSQMTTAASITNACARLLQTRAYHVSSSETGDSKKETPAENNPNVQQRTDETMQKDAEPQKKFNLMGLKKNEKDRSDE